MGLNAHADGSLTLDNASVQRLLDYGVLHYTNDGWVVSNWPENNEARTDPSPALGDVDEMLVERAYKEGHNHGRANPPVYQSADEDWQQSQAKAALASLHPNRDDHAMCHEEGCSLAHIPYRLASCGCLQPNRDVSAPCSTCEGTGIYNSYDDDEREFECYECDGSGVASLSSTDGEPKKENGH
jgi:hypothetical protein